MRFPISLSDQQQGITIAWLKRAETDADQSGERGRSSGLRTLLQEARVIVIHLIKDMMLKGYIAANVLLRLYCDAGSACVCSSTVTVAYGLLVPPYCFVAKSVLQSTNNLNTRGLFHTVFVRCDEYQTYACVK